MEDEEVSELSENLPLPNISHYTITREPVSIGVTEHANASLARRDYKQTEILHPWWYICDSHIQASLLANRLFS